MATNFDELPLAVSLEFNPESNDIDLTIFEHVLGREPVPLNLKYEYAPDCGFAPS